MKMKISSFLLMFSASLGLILTSCKADVDLNDISPEIELDLGLALPIGSTTITIGDFLGEELFDSLYVDENGEYFISFTESYLQSLPEIGITSAVSLEDTTFALVSQFLPAPFPPVFNIPFPANTNKVLSFPLEFSAHLLSNNIDANLSSPASNAPRSNNVMAKSDQEESVIDGVDQVVVDGATLAFNLDKSPAFGIDYSDIDSITLVMDENVFDFGNFPNSFKVPVGSGFGTDHVLDLPSFTTNFLDASGNKVEDIKLDLEIHITTKGDRTISNGASVDFGVAVNRFEVETVYGDFDLTDVAGDFDIDLSEILDFSEFSNESWILPFNNPQISISAQTDFGIPLQVDFDYIRVEQNAGATITADFDGSPNYTYQFVNLPVNVGDTACNALPVFNKDLGGLDLLFVEFPKKFQCAWDVSVNPTYDPSYVSYFSSGSFMNVDFQAKIPFVFNEGIDVNYMDTLVDVSFPDSLSQYGKVELDAYLLIENELPFAVDAELIFLDENNVDLGLELIAQDGNQSNIVTIGAADVDNAGSVVAPHEVSMKIAFNTQDDLGEIAKILYKLNLGDNAGLSALNSNNSLEIKVGVAAKGDLILDFDSFNNNN